MNEPFTKEEKKVMDLLVEAHNLFAQIEPTHQNDILNWVDGIHKCQDVLKGRVVTRDYPEIFNNTNTK
jgi:hypothetical protein